VAAYQLFDLSWLHAFLLGGDRVDRRRGGVSPCASRTCRRLASAEAETGGNDPMAIALTVGLID
jgi:NhaP-type Na+/H+ and K+/H+ antiporter